MKKLLIPTAAMIALSATAQAGFNGPGATPKLAQVSAIETMNDDKEIILEGYISEKVGDEHYRFHDRSGEVMVEIDDDDFHGLNVSTTTKVRIYGEVDKDLTSVSVEADRLEIVTKTQS